MNRSGVVIVDYGLGNLASVAMAVEAVGHSVALADSVNEVRRADQLILPGVGAFSVAMKLLTESGLGQAVKDAVSGGAKLLGICLGMQLLFDASTEFGGSEGLALLPGEVTAIRNPNTPSAEILRKTHIGWRELSVSNLYGQHHLFDGIPVSESAFYFVHSYAAQLTDHRYEMATVNYGTERIVAVCGKERIFGVQFHPEKSGRAGLKMLGNFLAL